MARKKRLPSNEQKKGAPATTESTSNSLSVNNSTTKNVINQDETKTYADSTKARHFWFLVYPSEDYVKKHYPDCTYDGQDGWGTAPDDWIDQLQETGLAFEVSELHYLDKVSVGSTRTKKPHWHVIVSWGNTTTYKTAKGLCDMLHSPAPKILYSVMGTYRYHRHLDNPEKHQYETYGKSYNGWTPPLDANDVGRIKREILELILLEDIQEYTELVLACVEQGPAYEDVVMNNVIYCDKLVTSYRHNRERALLRYYNQCDDAETKEIIKSRMVQAQADYDERTGEIIEKIAPSDEVEL